MLNILTLCLVPFSTQVQRDYVEFLLARRTSGVIFNAVSATPPQFEAKLILFSLVPLLMMSFLF